MISVLVSLLLSARSCLRSRAALQLEVLALRHQLQVLNRSRPRRLRLVTADRWLWAWLSHMGRSTEVSCARSRHRVPRLGDNGAGDRDRRGGHGRSCTVAERLRRALDRVHSPRMPRSHHHRQRARAASRLARVRPLLFEITDSSCPQQRRAPLAAGRVACRRAASLRFRNSVACTTATNGAPRKTNAHVRAPIRITFAAGRLRYPVLGHFRHARHEPFPLFTSLTAVSPVCCTGTRLRPRFWLETTT